MGVVDSHINGFITEFHMKNVGELLGSDVLIIFSPITYGLDQAVKVEIEACDKRKKRLTIILDTGGGVIGVVERMVNTIRHFYDEVDFIIPDRAMSAGTVFALSADNIYMNYFSYLGPIDPQVLIDDQLRPALGYLAQYERLVEKAANDELTSAEALLLDKLDLADLYQFEQAREHSVELLEEWLSTYKFKNWDVTETQGTTVTPEMKRERAKEIANVLNDTERWHTHGRGISMKTLTDELQLKIKDFDQNADIANEIRNLTDLIIDYTRKTGAPMFVRMWCDA